MYSKTVKKLESGQTDIDYRAFRESFLDSKQFKVAASKRDELARAMEHVVVAPGGRPFSVMGFTVRGGRIVEIDAISDPERLRRLDLAVLDD